MTTKTIAERRVKEADEALSALPTEPAHPCLHESDVYCPKCNPAGAEPTQTGGWVRVDARLPALNQCVLCAYMEHTVVTVGDEDVSEWKRNIFMGEGHDGWVECYAISTGELSYITHWQPLPALPSVDPQE